MADVEAHRPTRLYVEPTQRCNLRCAYCDRSFPRYPPDDLPIAWLQSVLKDIVPDSEVEIAGAGEPLLAGHLKEILDLLAGFPLVLVTNGTLLSDRIPILRGRRFREVAVSLDAADPTALAQTRQGVSIERVRDGLVSLRSSYPQGQLTRIVIQAVVNKPGLAYLPGLIQFAAECRADAIRILRRLSPPSYTPELFWSEPESYRSLNASREIATSLRVAFEFVRPAGGARNQPCSLAENVYLKANGRVKACLFDPAWQGLLSEDDFRCIWNSTSYRALRAITPNERGALGFPCRKCPHRRYQLVPTSDSR